MGWSKDDIFYFFSEKSPANEVKVQLPLAAAAMHCILNPALLLVLSCNVQKNHWFIFLSTSGSLLQQKCLELEEAASLKVFKSKDHLFNRNIFCLLLRCFQANW